MSEGIRRLAAIMFTDMVGYTALSQRNEKLALELLGKHRELIRPILAKHRGREIKTIGDAFLVELESALEAVECAVEVQKVLRDYNVNSSNELAVRIGIHVGDVIHQQEDVYGDAVNIASRIEPLAESGGICISAQTYDQVRNKAAFELVKLQPKEMKNVAVHIDVYKVELPWEKKEAIELDRGPLPTDRIAVLPFVSISPDPADEYFADGMTEELITSLSLIRGFKVIARTSVMNYKKKEKKVSEIGRELAVGTIVEGSVRKAGERIRVTVQVIDVNSEEHLWSSKYDSGLANIFDVQSDIASKVAESLPGALASVKLTATADRGTEDLTAYTNFLQGRELMHNKLEGPLRQSIQFFEQAVERDPHFARSFVGMAQAYVSLGTRGFIPWRESVDTAKTFLDKALSINESLAEAHSLRSELAYMNDAPFEVMEEEAQKAIRLNPNLADAYFLLAEVKAIMWRPQEWVRLLETAYQVDPLSARIIERLSAAYLYTGREADALRLLRRTQHLQPFNTHRWMWMYHASKGNYDDASKEVAQLEHLEPTSEYTLFSKGFLAALKGDRQTAEAVIASLDQTHMTGWARASFAGLIFFAIGDMDVFFERMREAAENHTLRANDLMYCPLFAKARADPRMQQVFTSSGLDWKPNN